MKKTVLTGIMLFMTGLAVSICMAEDPETATAAQASTGSDEITAIGSERQLFLDDQWLIASMDN
ncbi:MAG: hypothetical protein IKW74_06280, partial [Thermoguttaceae bacterium]|nr:hypothetical protein [Thermoguttaceae bacterium]